MKSCHRSPLQLSIDLCRLAPAGCIKSLPIAMSSRLLSPAGHSSTARKPDQPRPLPNHS